MKLARKKFEIHKDLKLKKGEIIIFTDGSSSNTNTRCGGWASLTITSKGRTFLVSDNEEDTTNNRMELIAILDSLRRLTRIERNRKKKIKRIKIVSDSGYSVFPFMQYNWIDKWKSGNFDKGTLNYDLWSEVIPLVIRFGDRLEFIHIVGHTDTKAKYEKARSRGQCLSHDYYNQIVDKYAGDARISLERKLGLVS